MNVIMNSLLHVITSIIAYYYKVIMRNNSGLLLRIITYFYILTPFYRQVSMAEYGFDVPCSRKPGDEMRRRIIFEIVSQYCFSKDDLAEIDSYAPNIQDLWLQTFTNSQSVMLRSKLLQSA